MRCLIVTIWSLALSSICYGQNDNFRLFKIIKKQINPEVPIVDAFTPPWTELISGLHISDKYKQRLLEKINKPCATNIRTIFPFKTNWINFDSANKYVREIDPTMRRPSNVPRSFYFFTCPIYSDDIAIVHLIVMGTGWETFVFRKNKRAWMFRLTQPKWKLERTFQVF